MVPSIIMAAADAPFAAVIQVECPDARVAGRFKLCVEQDKNNTHYLRASKGRWQLSPTLPSPVPPLHQMGVWK